MCRVTPPNPVLLRIPAATRDDMCVGDGRIR